MTSFSWECVIILPAGLVHGPYRGETHYEKTADADPGSRTGLCLRDPDLRSRHAEEGEEGQGQIVEKEEDREKRLVRILRYSGDAGRMTPSGVRVCVCENRRPTRRNSIRIVSHSAVAISRE